MASSMRGGRKRANENLADSFVPARSVGARVRSLFRFFSSLPIVISVMLGSSISLILWLHRAIIGQTLITDWQGILFWVVLVLLVNFIHYEMDPLQFTLDMPLLLTAALLYHPAVAACVALVGSTDVREFRGQVTLGRAVFNRSQVALSVFAASTVFSLSADVSSHWFRSIVSTIMAIIVFHSLNVGFVAAYVASSGRVSPTRVFRRLSIGRPIQYALTYFGYGMLALVMARLFADVGPWSVVLFLTPIVVAHYALVRAERLQALANRLRSRERLLERLSEGMADERKDERLRIASGLHDDVLQGLIRISQLSSFLRKETQERTQARQDAVELQQQTEDTMQTLRDVLGDLRKSPLGRGGLLVSLQGLARDLAIQWQVPISVDGPRELNVAPEAQLAAYHVAREAILNALKHAEASSVRVTIGATSESLRISVADDGCGFEPDAVDESVHFGLGLMRERVALHGGSLLIESSRETGTRLVATLRAQRNE